MTVALKPKLITVKEMETLKKKFSTCKCVASTYKTRFGNTCLLYTYYQWNEKVGQLHDYGYADVFKDFIHMVYYTDNKQWMDD